jgi:hypothetical protein
MTRTWIREQRVIGFALLIATGCPLVGCVSIQVEPLSDQLYPAPSQRQSMAVLDAEPARPHVKLARIIATSQHATEDRLKDKILARAKALGADAVVLGQVDMIESMGAGAALQNTMSTTGVSGSFFGGWWSPFYLDPWTYQQTASDQTSWTMYLSGVAIKYIATQETDRRNDRRAYHGETADDRVHRDDGTVDLGMSGCTEACPYGSGPR